MKMTRVYVAGVLCCLSLLGYAQTEVFAPIKEALKTGSAKELVKHFNASVDIDLDGDERTYSKAQAELVMRDFFKKHAVSDFNIVHNGSSKDHGLKFAIGRYESAGESYNVLIRVKEVDNVHLIHEIKFRKE